MVKINKQDVIKYGLLASLFTNFTIGCKYVFDFKEHEQKIHKLEQYNKELSMGINDLVKISSKLSKKQQESRNKIILLRDELKQIINKNKLILKENIKLKKELKRKEVSGKRKLNMTLTFYGSDCSGCSGITKSGISVKNSIYYKGYNVIAADPKVIPLHSIIKIETKNRTFYGYVADTGSAIKNNVLDVLVGSEAESYKYGRQQATVTVIREGGNS
ncbi:3D domain-containing protein [Neobacillus sp. YIM B02564]|uniref:3D domain-containing protein n=1 Tax=Neobacillus paridis TaxID=2803862 RepID=A0ABS1TLA2_9BACI|nr:3D domain-containing protein [Neobacillus paridis]MBL4951071.1 3D domain-containing protein [Neobacillus paridis]